MKTFIAHIYYAEAKHLGPIVKFVKAESKSQAEYKLCKYIEANLQGQRSYTISDLEVAMRFGMID